MEHGARHHRKYSGSNAHRFKRCHGQVHLAGNVQFKIPESDDSVEGVAAHELLETCLKVGMPQRSPTESKDLKERLDSAQHVVDYIEMVREEFPDLQVYTEHFFHFPQSVVDAEDAGGIVDVLLYSPSANRYWIIDFKFGVGETVLVEESDQIKFYGTSALWFKGFSKATLVIIQPRSLIGAEPRELDFTVSDMLTYQEETEDAIRACEAAGAPLCPGSWCHHCAAGADCLAREKNAIAVLTGDTRLARDFNPTGLIDPRDVPLDRIGWILSMREQVFQWFKAVADGGMFQARQGTKIPHMKLVLSTAHRRYIDKPDLEMAQLMVRMAGGAHNVADFMPPTLLALTNAEKLLAQLARDTAGSRKKTEAVADMRKQFAFLTTKDTNGELSLVPESDKRPAYDSATDDFAGVVPAPDVLTLGPAPSTDGTPNFMDFYRGQS